jgi:hypothetical protein
VKLLDELTGVLDRHRVRARAEIRHAARTLTACQRRRKTANGTRTTG